MWQPFPLAPFALLLLVACSASERTGPGGSAEQSADQADKAARPVPRRMAYSYSYRFTVPEKAIPAAQERHVAMCDRLGLARCRLLESHRSVGEYGSASIKLEVASAIARPFAAGLVAPVAALGGALQSSDVEAEDLARRIVDVEARLRAKETLVARLNGALRTKAGPTADLVATEKAVADAQGELDAVRSELKLAQARIATSPIDIGYQRQSSFFGQVGDAFSAIGSVVTTSVVALIYVLAAAVPWAAVGSLILFFVRAVRRRLRRGRTPAA